MNSSLNEMVLEIRQLSIGNKKGSRLLHEVDLTARAGEMVGLVGESGCGKSITASAVMGLLPKQLKIAGGEILIRNQPVTHLSSKQMRPFRGPVMSMVFQDYTGSLTPFIKIGKQMIESIRSHQSLTKQQARLTAVQALERVRLSGERVLNSYPFELSGGQKQRVAIAMAMIHRPALLICDEPTTALDVVTGNHILALIDELRKETNCAVVYITHHLSEVLTRADRTVVMYGGRVIEEGVSSSIEHDPQHPFTELLLKSRPTFFNRGEKLPVIPGEPGDIAACGCPFVHRCPKRMEACFFSESGMIAVGKEHRVSCHLYSAASIPEYAEVVTT